FSSGGLASGDDGFSRVLPYFAYQAYVSPAQWLDFVINGGVLSMSTNGGLNWSQLNVRQFNDLAFLSGGTFIMSGLPPTNALTNNSEADLYSSSNCGGDWKPVISYYANTLPPTLI